MIVGKIVSALINDGPLGTLVDRLTPDVNLRKEAKIELEKSLIDTANAALLAQIEVNKQEAQHASIFVAGWRPGAGWVCVSALGFNFIIVPLSNYLIAIIDPSITPPPAIELGPLLTILLGMLGLGGLRTYEGLNGTKRNTL